ncbi:MAG: hypothetical protein JWQ11_1413, partial [Rhizobacter sp.]|nr:hypothetical protein [Rhizobacter sp.]
VVLRAPDSTGLREHSSGVMALEADSTHG